MDREIREFQASREKQLQEQSVRMRGGIVEEINKVIEAKVKAENYDLVFDKSGPSLNGVPVLLYSKETYEFTNDVGEGAQCEQRQGRRAGRLRHPRRRTLLLRRRRSK